MSRRAPLCLLAALFASACGPAPAPVTPPPELAPPGSAASPPQAPSSAPSAAPSVHPPKEAEKPRAETPEDDDIREAVFRHVFLKNASGRQQSAKVYCLQVEGKSDPSDKLLARFQGHSPPVKKQSRCKADMGKGVYDLDTGEPGLIFRVDSIERTGPDSATVRGGYYEAGLSSSGNVYTVARENGRWTVTADKMLWISSVPDKAAAPHT